jgi:hypothetical protein
MLRTRTNPELFGRGAETAGRTSLLLRSFEVWLLIAAAESLHGTLREALIAPRIGDFRARQIAVFSGSAIIIAIAFLFRKWINARSMSESLEAGAFWVVLTLAFEIGLGRLVMGLPWDRILSDYDIVRGGLMPIGLVIMLLAPAIAARLSAGSFMPHDNADAL